MITPREYANRASAWRQVFARLYQEARAHETDHVTLPVPLTAYSADYAQLVELCEYVIDTVQKGEDDARLRGSAG